MSRRDVRSLAWLAAALLAAVSLGGCSCVSEEEVSPQGKRISSHAGSKKSPDGPRQKGAGSKTNQDDGAHGGAKTPVVPPGGEVAWLVVHIQGKPVGQSRQLWLPQLREGANPFEQDFQLTVMRDGTPTSMSSQVRGTETAAGAVDYRVETLLSSRPNVTVGKAGNGRLEVETSSQGKPIKSEMLYEKGSVSPFAVERSLRSPPMKPGETRSLRQLDVTLHRIADVTLTARQQERTELLDSARELLRVDVLQRIADGAQPVELRAVVWVDAEGAVWKHQVDAQNATIYRASEAVAKALPKQKFDLFTYSLVKLTGPETPAGKLRVRYKVRLKDDSPADRFASGPGQTVEAIDEHTAQITVTARSVGDKPLEKQDDPPRVDDHKPGALIQSDDAKVVALAEKAQGKDAAALAVAIEKLVHESIERVDYATGFASAAEVAETLRGDCTEHAVLLAALARAKGIPARVAMGLVYVPGKQGFLYHMWNELWIDDRWVAFDAVAGGGRMDATRIKVAHSSLSGVSPAESFLAVGRVLGQLSIELIEVQNPPKNSD